MYFFNQGKLFTTNQVYIKINSILSLLIIFNSSKDNHWFCTASIFQRIYSSCQTFYKMYRKFVHSVKWLPFCQLTRILRTPPNCTMHSIECVNF